MVLVGHVLFWALLVLSLKYVELRTIHVDSAYQIFKWVQFSGVEVEAHRYSAVFPQLAVKLGRALGLGLYALLCIASVMHVLVPYAIFILAAHLWRVPWIAIGVALAAVLCTRLTFYGIVLEANYLLSYPFLLAAVLLGPVLHKDRCAPFLALAALFLLLAVHPVGFLIALFTLFMLWVEGAVPLRPLVILGSISVAWGGTIRWIVPPTVYENGIYEAAMEGAFLPSTWISSKAMEYLVEHSWNSTMMYLPAWGLLILTLFLAFKLRSWWVLVGTTLSVLGYIWLHVFTYSAGETAMMMEKNFVPLATLIVLPLLILVQKLPVRAERYMPFAFLCLAFVQFRGISFASRSCQERLDSISRLVAFQQERGLVKALIGPSDLDQFGVNWALPQETLLLSGLNGPERCTTAASSTVEGTCRLGKGIYLDAGHCDMDVEQLRTDYFVLPVGPYQRVNLEGDRSD